jgi:hypothetical protein
MNFSVASILMILIAVLPALAPAQTPAKSGDCRYELAADSFKVEWTAFKTNAKTPVKGSFKKVLLEGASTSDTLRGLIKGLQVKIDSMSVDSGNPERDQTLSAFFFGKLASAEIQARIKSLDETRKSLVLALNLNNRAAEVPLTYTQTTDGLFVAEGEIDILNFRAKRALNSLHEKCVDLHRGSDGKSKTWPTVTLRAQAAIRKSCSY